MFPPTPPFCQLIHSHTQVEQDKFFSFIEYHFSWEAVNEKHKFMIVASIIKIKTEKSAQFIYYCNIVCDDDSYRSETNWSVVFIYYVELL